MAAAAPRRITITPWGLPYSSSGTWTRAYHVDSLSLGRMSGSAQNDELVWNVLLDSGTWALDVIGTTFTDAGIATCYLDATSLGTLDWYSGGAVNNVVQTITGISVAATGHYAFKIKATDKHASSSGYVLRLASITLRRTGA